MSILNRLEIMWNRDEKLTRDMNLKVMCGSSVRDETHPRSRHALKSFRATLHRYSGAFLSRCRRGGGLALQSIWLYGPAAHCQSPHPAQSR